MRNAFAAASLLLASTYPGLAEECADNFVRVLTNSGKMKPNQAHMVSQMTGQPVTENDFLSVAWDHYMVKPTKPKGPWILTYDGTMYQSSDEGKTWKTIRSFDKNETRASGIKTVKEQAGTVRYAVCGEEELDGVKHETLEADTTNLTPSKFELHTKYWVNRNADDFVTKADTRMKGDGYEVVTTQTWKPAPELTLPIPK
jgi:hypothetical protein